MYRKELIIDKDFLDNLYIEQDSYSDLHKDLEKFFNKIQDFDLVINMKDFHEFEKELNSNPLWELIIDLAAPLLIYKPNLIEEIFNKDFYNDNTPFKLFFLSLETEKCSELVRKYGYEYICPANIDDRWKIYSSIRPDLKRKVTKDKKLQDLYRFDSWAVLAKYAHPIHSIVIFDRYILVDEPKRRLSENLFPMLKEFTKYTCTDCKLNITIITQKIGSEQLNIAYDTVNNYLKRLDIKHFRLNIIIHDKHLYPPGLNGLHSRRIYTNYFMIKSDDSFTYFQPGGRINNTSDIEFEFIFNNFEWQSMSKDLSDLSKYVHNLKLKSKTLEIIDKPYFPDAKNRLLEL